MTYSADPSVLPSPPTSPTSPNRTAATRIRIKAPRPVSISNVPTPRTKTHAERTRSTSPSLSGAMTSDGVMPGSEIKGTAPAASAVASKRRQSSIAYYTPSSPSPWSQRPQLNRSVDNVEPIVVNARENVSKRSSLVLSSRAPSTRESISSSEATGAREPLTLVEKHADLFHFIAQKERKCLELRDQLAAHEKELAELKRKWGRIVNHGDPLLNPSSTTGIGGVTLDGLKEGVRMITAGFSDLGGVIQELESGGDTSSKPEGEPSGAARDNSSASNSRTSRTNSEHLSTSSQEGIHTSDHVLGGRDRELTTVATAPSLTRTGSLNYRMHKRTSRVIAQESTTPPSSTPISPSSQSPKSGVLDPGMSFVLAPSPTLVPPLLGAASGMTTPAPAIGSIHAPVPTTTGSMSSWMDSMGKKLSELQKGQTFSNSQKRASSLLAGVSSTISSALLPGPTATTPAPVPLLTPTTTVGPRTKIPVIKQPPSPQFQSQSDSRAYPSYKSMTDWLDDEDEQTVHAGGILALDAKLQSRRAIDGAAECKEVDATATAVSSFDDDWNW